MGNKIIEQLNRELTKAKQERPALEKDVTATNDKILEESSGDAPRPLFFHNSHNSHGDWHKHWAHGGIGDEPQDGELLPGVDTPSKP